MAVKRNRRRRLEVIQHLTRRTADSPPTAYLEYDRRFYAGQWWFRVSPTSPWQLCLEEVTHEAH
jgi:hypothetical protein